MNRFTRLCNAALLAESTGRGPVPTTLAELTAWLHDNGLASDEDIDYENRTVKDAWGNDVVIILRNDRFFGLGSPGPDRTWQSGSGDNIIITLEDVK